MSPPSPPRTHAAISHALFEAPTARYSSSEYLVTARRPATQTPTNRSSHRTLTHAGAA